MWLSAWSRQLKHIALCDIMKILIRQGCLFRPLSPQGYVQPLPFDSSAAQGRLHFYVERRLHVFGNRKVTLHGLRNGCAISLAMVEAGIQSVMDHVGWNTFSMARHYIKLNQVFGSGGARDLLSTMPVDLTNNNRIEDELLVFFSSLVRVLVIYLLTSMHFE